MEKLNMANINMLIKKVYLLAGVIIAANMFVVNDVRAMKQEDKNNNIIINNDDIKDNENEKENFIIRVLDMTSGFVLKWENLFNFIGGAVFSGANNYFKWWDYKPGKYWQFGCVGWRSKRFLNDILQFEVNFINLGRGGFWLLPGAFYHIKNCAYKNDKTKAREKGKNFYISTLFAELIEKKVKNKTIVKITVYTLFPLVFLLQGFLSIPLTVHIPKINLSISISFDSIIWGVIGFFLDGKEEQPNKENPNEKNEIELKNI